MATGDHVTRAQYLRQRAAGSEAEFQWRITKLAALYGWRVYHTYDSRRSQPGFPDLVLVRPPRLLFVELKSATGRPTAAQQEWLMALAGVTRVDARIWRPSQWDEIAVELAA